jgi:TonB family protein
MMIRFWRQAFVLLALALLPAARAEAETKSFVFVNAQYVITAEVASKKAFVVNFINLSDFVIVVQPNEFIYRAASGRYYIGQVFEAEHTDRRGMIQKYKASVLLKGRSFVGLTVLGAFYEQESIEDLSIRIGAKRFYLEPMEAAAFESFAEQVSKLDIESSNPAAALKDAGIAKRGTVRRTEGTSEWDRDWEGLLGADGVNPPKIIEKPEISPTNEAVRARVYGKVTLKAIVNKSGGIQDLRVVKGLGRGLDQRALDGVANSWIFLPATKNGEVMDTEVTFDVDFPPPEEKP